MPAIPLIVQVIGGGIFGLGLIGGLFLLFRGYVSSQVKLGGVLGFEDANGKSLETQLQMKLAVQAADKEITQNANDPFDL